MRIHQARRRVVPASSADSTGIRRKFELHRSTGLLLDNDSSGADLPTDYDITDLDLYDIAAAQFAIDSEIKQSPISCPPMLIEKEPNCPHLTRFEGGTRLPIYPPPAEAVQHRTA
jgi:hypothetical protein